MTRNQKLTTYTRQLKPTEGQLLRQVLDQHGFEFYQVPYAQFAARKPDVTVTLYQSGKLVVQGKGTREFVEFVLEPEVLFQAELGYEAVHHPEWFEPHIGIDESGKGDIFGPLCVAAVYISPETAQEFFAQGVKDSKRIGSRKTLSDLAKQIRNAPGCVYDLVVIGPEAYNRLVEKIGNVNRLLAWGHARALENLLEKKGSELHPPPNFAISDQFASSRRVVETALMQQGRELKLIQRTKAESDPAVAAASILAREEFLRRLDQLSARFGIRFPRGAGPACEEALREFVEKYGRKQLSQVAKIHFANVRHLLENEGM